MFRGNVASGVLAGGLCVVLLMCSSSLIEVNAFQAARPAGTKGVPNSNSNIPQQHPASAAAAAAATETDQWNEEVEEVNTAQPRRHSRGTAEVNEDEDSGNQNNAIVYGMEHSLDGQTFETRGSVSISFSSLTRSTTVKFNNEQANSKRVGQLFKRLLPNGHYRIRFLLPSKSADQSATYVQASIPACLLLSSSFRELFVFHFDQYGTLIGVNYKTTHSTCESNVQMPSTFEFVSRGKVNFGRSGEKVLANRGAGPQANANAAGAAGAGGASSEQGENAPPVSFWSKYWMYIVPFGIFMLLQAMLAPPEGQTPGNAAAQ